MAITDILFTTVSKRNLTNSQTFDVPAAEQVKISEFLTVQSMANFTAITAAITLAWKALQHLPGGWFASELTPFFLAEAWLAVSLITTAVSKTLTPGRILGSGRLSFSSASSTHSSCSRRRLASSKPRF